ncbi:2Fe-2S ferredoxin [Algoriphagus ratkowskyi]|uniref:2Fe-2S ferredoxin n=1 Tax=Algoriphagus ratkowskyi TaxID=57028 RepID=A0A2W7SS19_9BACT|nr:2Fe-2S iron-sulfur cluster-binding protein [Algoriphagus ratkowskyi]PZX53432.1 2Fe-2S ferredoxin [Algoriphagus ratkowskyi]TXD76525.1 2Fe-2S iron-sulfur cluster binding domain-containing protein [Algoriphagus ratkowskyi]
MSRITFTLIDTIGKIHEIVTQQKSYPSLMELIVNELLEDIGDCKGRIWCGTCIVKQVKGSATGPIDTEEANLLSEYPNEDYASIRLSCQLEITSELEGTSWLVVDSRLDI